MPLYWTGNAAKARIVDEILTQFPKATILDYGCGNAGDWPAILKDHPGLRLIGYEPFAPSREAAKRKLAGLNAELIGDIETAALGVDLMVSFSVFEHVYDREAYLRHAWRHLKPGGLFYLNYDDGHFRNTVDLDGFRNFKSSFKTWVLNRLGPRLAEMGRLRYYQSRVDSNTLEEMVGSAGFKILEVHYENCQDLKTLARYIGKDRAEDYCRFWIEVEKKLNEFKRTIPRDRGDTCNLWQVMPSRTLKLTR